MWLFLQSSIVFLVVASNIYWEWTPNGYVASGLGIGLALIFTLLANDIAELRARKKRRSEAGE
jgi:hypothetical protein